MILQALIELPAKLYRRMTRGVQTQPNTTPVRHLNVRAYLGRWYEQARYEHRFERGMDGVFTTYTLTDGGNISVLNVGYDAQGKEHRAKGEAQRTARGGGALSVSFVPPYIWFGSPYHVLYVDEHYTEALVSGAGNDYLWLLTRRPHPGFSTLKRLLQEAKRRGFDLHRLRRTKQGADAA